MRAKLTPAEEEIINVSFEAFSEETAEKNQNGDAIRVITTESLREAFLSIDASGDIHDVQLMIDDIDANSDGKIDVHEWTGIMTRKLLGEDGLGSAPHVFKALDDNKDGFIPYVELRQILMKEGMAPLSEQEVDELGMFADPDADGLINYREFLRWLGNPHWQHNYDM
jgi:Ca2+-binding EF-hand superfamily protein